MNGVTEFLIVGNTVTMKRGNTIIKEKKAKSKKRGGKDTQRICKRILEVIENPRFRREDSGGLTQ